MSTTAYLCLGSNIKPEENIRFAVARFKHDFAKVTLSNIYKSSSVGFTGDDFLNLAMAVQTELSLDQLLDYVDALEREAGRVRVQRGRYDSRTLDVDVVMYGDLTGKHKGREWPSDDIDKEAHVLLPISEVAGCQRHPRTGLEFGQLWHNFDQDKQALKRVYIALSE